MKILRNKRGAALESAILFMMVVLMLGMLLTGVIMYTHLRVKANDTLLTREIAIEQIGHDFVHGTLVSGENGEIEGNNAFTAVIETNADNTRILTLKNKANRVVLYVEIPENSTTPSVWKYTK